VPREEEPTTQELQLAALRREQVERAAAGGAIDPNAGHAHERRADKTAYLREKLAERAESEREDA